MSKHTPGPWRLVNTNDGPTIAGATPGYLATTRGRFALKSQGEEDANARLIAAAPELLKALTVMVLVHSDPTIQSQCDAIDLAVAAIANANGE